MASSETPSAANKARQFDKFVKQQIERMPQMTDPIRGVVRNILHEPIPLEVQERLLKPMLSQKYHPKPPQRLRRKVVLDRQPLLGTGPLPDWLRNLAHGRSMVALDTYRDNLCLWRCIAVHQGARIDRSTEAARRLAKSFFKLETVPIDWPKISRDELDEVERHLKQGAAFSDWLGFRVYEPVRI
ncbi:hypothetical protein ACROYT_G005442 [Oculina patagonica]